MIEFQKLPDDSPDLRHSPLLRAARLTLQYTKDSGTIGLTKTKAFKRVFVHWAAENFEWPGMNAEQLFRYNKVLNEYEFPPLEVLHFLLTEMQMGRHYKGEFRITKRGKELTQSPGRLFAKLISFFLLNVDHASYSRLGEKPIGRWDVWLNVINVEANQGAPENKLFSAFYGNGLDWGSADWRKMTAFSSCVLRPLEWSGLLLSTEDNSEGRSSRHWFKTPLWRSALKLETDEMLAPMQVQ